MDELRGEADLAETRDDFLQTGVGVAVGALGDGVVGLVLEPGGLEPEAGEARWTGGCREELELQRGQTPVGWKGV